MTFNRFTLYNRSLNEIAGITVDSVISEDITLNNSITSSPVETGKIISDGMVIQPIEIRITAIVSDLRILKLQILRVANQRVAGTDDDEVTSETVAAQSWDALELQFAKRELLDVQTTLKTYTNMVLTSLAVNNTGQNIGSLQFTASFKEVILADSIEAEFRQLSELQPAQESSKGHQQGNEPTNNEEVRTSGALRLKRRLVGG